MDQSGGPISYEKSITYNVDANRFLKSARDHLLHISANNGRVLCIILITFRRSFEGAIYNSTSRIESADGGSAGIDVVQQSGCTVESNMRRSATLHGSDLDV